MFLIFWKLFFFVFFFFFFAYDLVKIIKEKEVILNGNANDKSRGIQWLFTESIQGSSLTAFSHCEKPKRTVR